MKKFKRSLLLAAICLFIYAGASAQAQELEELALDIEKLAQFKTILSDLKKGFEILSGGYTAIKNIAEGNFNIHKAFLDGLLAVNPVLMKYGKIVNITDNQRQLINEYKKAFSRFKKNGQFMPGEIEYMGRVYRNLLDESVSNLEELLRVITAGSLRMSDDERISAIDRIDDQMENKLSFLRYFNNNAALLSVQRKKENMDLNTGRALQGIK